MPAPQWPSLAPSPVQPAAEAQARSTFLALMWALSYPGSRFALPADSDEMTAIGQSLLDLETSYFTPEASLSAHFAKTGAIAQPIQHADFLFFPNFTSANLLQMPLMKVGSFDYPDRSATLIIGCEFDGPSGTCLSLVGPGNRQDRTIRIAGVPVSFWEARHRIIRYPLGIDILFVSHGWVLGLPRTTQVTVCM